MASDTTSCATLVLKANGLIAHYTDTVLGLACLPNEFLLQRLQRIKRRSNTKGFIILVSSAKQLLQYAKCNSTELSKIDLPQPKPTTWLVQSNENSPSSLLGPSNKIAVRITNHPSIKSICDNIGPIVSTSANLSKQAMCTNLSDVRKIFGPNIDYLHFTENTGTNQPSTVIDLDSGKVMRK